MDDEPGWEWMEQELEQRWAIEQREQEKANENAGSDWKEVWETYRRLSDQEGWSSCLSVPM